MKMFCERSSAVIPAVGYSTNHSFTSLGFTKFDRRDVGPDDVRIEVLCCDR